MDGVLLEANAGFRRLLPATCAQPIGATVARYFTQPSFADLIAASAQEGQDGYRGLLTIGDYAATTRTLRGRVWQSGRRIRVLAEYDIDELERLTDVMLELNREASVAQLSLTRANVTMQRREVQLLETSYTDALTGVGNRRKLDQALAAELSRVQRSGGALSVIMTDIDHFKLINDEFGHAIGDKVLAHFGTLLRTHTRITDIVARFGGEEFVALLPYTDLAHAQLKAEQLRGALALDLIAPLLNPVTASFGVVEYAAPETGAELLRRVDAALYKAKADGRNRVVAENR